MQSHLTFREQVFAQAFQFPAMQIQPGLDAGLAEDADSAGCFVQPVCRDGRALDIPYIPEQMERLPMKGRY